MPFLQSLPRKFFEIHPNWTVHRDISIRGGWQLALNLVDLPGMTQETVALVERSCALSAQWQAAFWLWEEVRKKRVEWDAMMLTSAISAYERGRLCFRGVQHPHV